MVQLLFFGDFGVGHADQARLGLLGCLPGDNVCSGWAGGRVMCSVQRGGCGLI
jgi:hypothetical protein